jgi:hypothetical protein
VESLVHRGVKQQVNVIYLKKQLRLFLPVNTPPLRLLNAKQLEQVDKYLNSPKRLLQKRRDLDEKIRAISKISEALPEGRKLSNAKTRKGSETVASKTKN